MISIFKKTILLSLVILNNTTNAQINKFLDNSFNSNGKNITSFGNGKDYAEDIAIQTSNGKIIVAGASHNGTNYDFAVARYNADGTLDNTFGQAGKVTTEIGTGNDYVYAIALQLDNKIVVCGYTITSQQSDFAIARYNTDGSLDNTFGNNGVVVIDIDGLDDAANSLVIRPNGKIAVTGRSNDGSYDLFATVQLTDDGSIDNTFGINGVSKIRITPNKYCRAYASVLQPDGKIVIGGNTWVTTTTRFAICRIKENGTLDSSFATNGTLQTNYHNSTITSLALQPDGQVIAAGIAGVSGSNSTRIAMAKYTSDGVHQSGFNNATTQYLQFGGNSSDAAYDIALKSNGDIVLACSTYDDYQSIGERSYFLLAYFDSVGYLRSTSSSVSTMTPGANASDEAYAIAVQPDSKIVLAGTTKAYNSLTASTTYQFAVARYTAGVTGIAKTLGNINFVTTYPNPSPGIFTVSFETEKAETIQLKVYDLLGQVVKEESPVTVSGIYNQQLNITQMPKGIYLLQIKAGEETISKRIEIQ